MKHYNLDIQADCTKSLWYAPLLSHYSYVAVVIPRWSVHLQKNFCPLNNLSCFFVVCWFFQQSTFSENSFRNTLLGLTWFQTVCKLSPDNTRGWRVKWVLSIIRKPKWVFFLHRTGQGLQSKSLNLCMLGNLFMLLLLSDDFSKKKNSKIS